MRSLHRLEREHAFEQGMLEALLEQVVNIVQRLPQQLTHVVATHHAQSQTDVRELQALRKTALDQARWRPPRQAQQQAIDLAQQALQFGVAFGELALGVQVAIGAGVQFDHLRADAVGGFHFGQFAGSQQRLVVFHKNIHIVHMDKAAAQHPGHMGIDLGDDHVRRLGRGQGNIHGNPQAHPAEIIRR